MKRLRSCEGCARHVYASETVCPFCSAALAPSPEPGEVTVPSGASRAQRLALAAALGSSSLLACAQTNTSGLPVSPPQTAGSAPSGQTGTAGTGAVPPRGAVDAGFATPVYGAPLAGSPAPSAGRAAPPRAGQRAPQPAGQGGPTFPAYGVPIAGQPAPDDDAGVPAAGSGGHGGQIAAPVYGAPIPEYGAPPPPKD
ncbi:MAG TPA: hypothetical protein VJR89_18525 [Polyangiales bacterium]|nr:hypothetical protein [Polyangiales bacterium]